MKGFKQKKSPTPSIIQKDFDVLRQLQNGSDQEESLVSENSMMELHTENSGKPLKNIKMKNFKLKNALSLRFKDRFYNQEESELLTDSDKLKKLNNYLESTQNLKPKYYQCQRFEKDYYPFLDSRSSNQEIIVLDQKQALMRPQVIEKKLKDQFMNNLRDKKKIDNYEIQLQPILLHLIDDQDDEEQNFDMLHHETVYAINQYHEALQSRNSRSMQVRNDNTFHELKHNAEPQDMMNLSHSICKVDIEYYSMNDKRKFLIVRTIEEMEDHKQFKFVVQTIRVLTEQLSNEFPPNVQFGMMSQMSSQGNVSCDGNHQSNKSKFARFKQIKQFIVSDSGPISPKSYLPLPKYNQPTSIIYIGKSFYFFKKKYLDSQSIFILNEFDLQDRCLNVKEDFIIQSATLDESVSIHFAQEGESKGQKIDFSDEEIQQKTEECEAILRDYFVQIVDNFELDLIQIYSMNDLTKCLTPNLRHKSKFGTGNKRFNQVFVIRDCVQGKNEVDKLFDMKSHNYEIKFVCLYDFSYMVVNLKISPEGNLETSLEHTCRYLITKSKKQVRDKECQQKKRDKIAQDKEIDAKRSKQKFVLSSANQDRVDHNERGSVIRKASTKDMVNFYDFEKQKIKGQVKMLQSACVLRYSLGSDLLAYYFDYNKINDIEQKYMKSDDFENQEEIIYSLNKLRGQVNHQHFKEHVRILYFIDDNSQIQIVNLEKMPDDMEEAINKHYVQHIKTKIGHPYLYEKQDFSVVATYVRNELSFQDVKFVGLGMIEQFVEPDPVFCSRQEQSQNSKYLIAQTNQDQILCVYKKHNHLIHKPCNKAINKMQQEFTFQIIKIKHLEGQNNNNQQQTIKSQLQDFLKSQDHQSQMRINTKIPGLMSSCFSIEFEQVQIKIQCSELDPYFKPMSHILKGQSTVFKNMIIESIEPPGRFMVMRMTDQRLMKGLEKKHQKTHKHFEPKFFFVPKSYFIRNDEYYIFVEMLVYLKEGAQEYYFVAENFLVKQKQAFKIEQQGRSDKNTKSILDQDTEVQFLIIPGDIQDHIHKCGTQEFTLSSIQRLADYNLYETKFFRKNALNFQELDFLENEQQCILKFEKIVTSFTNKDFVPFISYNKKITRLENINIVSMNQFNHFMIQAIHFSNNQLSITPCKSINTAQIDRKTIQFDSQIQMWRSTDFFKNSQNEIIAHYQVSLIFAQQVQRIQIMEYQLTFIPQKQKIKIRPITRIEKLRSSISQMTHNENIRVFDEKIEQMMEEETKEHLRMLKSNQVENDDQMSADAVTHFFEEQSVKVESQENELTPFVQFYKNSFCTFGYQKKHLKEARCFELTLKCSMNPETLKNYVFNQFEMYRIHQLFIKVLLQMKPVMLQDLEFLLSHSHSTYEFNLQRDEKFFQPQELYFGQSMCDLHLNETKKIHEEICNYMRLEENAENEKEGKEIPLPYEIEGSLMDLLLQNNPYKDKIAETSKFEIRRYLIVSQDFNLKTQIMRSLEMKADNSHRILLESLNDINDNVYSTLLENDLYKLLTKDNIQEMFSFFQVDRHEQILDQIGAQNYSCNFVQSLHEERAPTFWAGESQQISVKSFRDTLNQKEEIVSRLINIQKSQNDSSQNFEVKNKYIDFQNVQLGQKIRELNEFIDDSAGGDGYLDEDEIINCKLDNFQYYLDDLQIAHMMDHSDNNSEFYECESAQKIIDFQFIKAKRFFLGLLTLYIFFYMLPQFISKMVDDELVTKICGITSLSTLMIFLCLEFCQLKMLGCQDYFFDFWNLVDFTQAFVFAASTILSFYPNEDRYVLEMTLNLISLFQAFAKGLSFVRLSDDFGFLVRMIGITIIELKPFIAFFFLYSLFFSVAFSILTIDTTKYERLDKNFAYFLFGFRNSIGDFHQPFYQQWIDKYNDGIITQTDEYIIASYIWFVWILQAMFMVIILLNYLIAVISQAYERVVNQRIIYSYIHKSQINLDYFMMTNQIQGQTDPTKLIIFVDSSRYLIDKNQHWLGFLSQFKKQINKIQDAIMGKISKLQNELSENAKKGQGKDTQMQQQIDQICQDQKQMKANMYQIQNNFEQSHESLKQMLEEIQNQNSKLKDIISQQVKK